MPRLSQVVRDHVTLTIPLERESLSVTYRPSGITPAMQEAIKEAETTGSLRDALYGPLCALLAEWDLLEDDGAPIEITPARLRTLPIGILIAVFRAVLDDLRPNPTSAADSPPRLQVVESAGGSLIGTG